LLEEWPSGKAAVSKTCLAIPPEVRITPSWQFLFS